MHVINPIIGSSLKCELLIRLLRSSIRTNTSNRKTTEYLPVAGCNALWKPMASEMCPSGVDWQNCWGLQHNQTVLNQNRIKFKRLMDSTQTLRRNNLCWKFNRCPGLWIPMLPLQFQFGLALVIHLASLGKQCLPQIKRHMFKCLLDMTISPKHTKSSLCCRLWQEGHLMGQLKAAWPCT